MPAWIAATSSWVSGFRISIPETSPAKHGPIWRMATVMAMSSNSAQPYKRPDRLSACRRHAGKETPRRTPASPVVACWARGGCGALADVACCLTDADLGRFVDGRKKLERISSPVSRFLPDQPVLGDRGQRTHRQRTQSVRGNG